MPQRDMGTGLAARTLARKSGGASARGFRIVRTCGAGNPGTHARYDLDMTGRDPDRAEWSRIVRELLDEHTRGKKAPLARRLDISEKTIDRWLAGTVRVSEESVYRVAEAFGINPIDLLIRLGLVARREIPVFPAEVIDEEQRRVLDRDDLDADQKARIIAELESWRAADEELLERQRERDRRTREDRVDSLIERIRRVG